MFGLSLGKLLFTIFVVAAVFFGWRWLTRVQSVRGVTSRRVREKAERPSAPSAPPAVEAVDMVACPVCGDYVPAKGAQSCGRSGCPYPG